MALVYTPSNLDLDALLKQYPPSFNYSIDDFNYILGTIVRLMQYRDRKENDVDTDYANLNAAMLKKKVNDYSYYLWYLLEHKIIDSDYYYEVGIKSKGYKIADEYMQQGFVATQLSARKYTRLSPEKFRQQRRLRKLYGHLTQWFNPRLQIDYKGAMLHIEEMYERDLLAKMELRKAMRRLYLRRMTIDRIHQQDFVMSVDDTSRRFHSNLTTIKSELRNFITYDGEPLCAVDVCNSQPFISTILFNPAFYRKDKGGFNLYNLDRAIYKQLEGSWSGVLSIISSVSNITMLVKSHESQAQTDLQLYCTLVDKGGLYEYIYEEYAYHTGKQLDDRGELKKAIFQTLYSANRYLNHPRYEMKRFFKELFPTVYEIFAALKKVNNVHLAIILQLVESEVILRMSTLRLNAIHPKLPLFTIHDSVVSLESEKELVRQQLKMDFEAAIGLQPTLAYETWGAVVTPSR